MIVVLAFAGAFSFVPVIVGAIVILPYMFGNLIGARLFDPEKERTYRAVAYVVIAGSAASALPIWG